MINYYLDANLSYLIRIGELKHEIVDHSNPEDYNLTREQAINLKLKYLKFKKKEIEEEIKNIKTEYLLGKRPFAYLTINILGEKIKKIEKDIYFNKKNKNDSISFDIKKLKEIPLNEITDILPNGFFVNNPFRNENSPSDSLSWDKKVNKWTDFGSGERGDVFDLVMAIRKCTFYDACKILSNFT